MALLFFLARTAADLPLPGEGVASGSGSLTLVAGLLGAMALGSLTGIVGARREARSAARMARSYGHGLHELVETVRAGQDSADAGLWQYDPVTGEQQWSHAMRRLFGVDHSDPFVPGDAETLFCAHGIDLMAQVAQLAEQRTPYILDYALSGGTAPPRRVRVEACNLFDADGSLVRVLGVVREITDCTDCTE